MEGKEGPYLFGRQAPSKWRSGLQDEVTAAGEVADRASSWLLSRHSVRQTDSGNPGPAPAIMKCRVRKEKPLGVLNHYF